jgi:signal transduction histidine kinase
MSRINHDLRNSLASAMIVSDRLAQLDDPEVRKVTPRLMSAIDRAVKLCSQTLDYAHADTPALEMTQVPLHDLVRDVIETVQLTCDQPVRWRNHVPPGLIVRADRDQLFRLLFNLATNAAEAMVGDGAVTFAAAQLGRNVEIDIEDTGPGLSERAIDHLFEPFTGSSRAGGTGLGLAIAREIARFHGGDVALKETGPSGTVFRLSLPAN